MAFRTAWQDCDAERDAYTLTATSSTDSAVQAFIDRYPYSITKIVITDEDGDRLYVKPLKGDATIPAGYVEPDETDIIEAEVADELDPALSLFMQWLFQQPTS